MVSPSSAELTAIELRVHTALTRLYAGQSRDIESGSHGQSAAKLIHRLADSLETPEYRRTYLSLPDVQLLLTSAANR